MFLQEPHVHLLQLLCYPELKVIIDNRGGGRGTIRVMKGESLCDGAIDYKIFEHLLRGGLIEEVGRTPFQVYYKISRAGREELDSRGDYPEEIKRVESEAEAREAEADREERERKEEVLEIGMPGVRAASYKLPKGRGYVVTCYVHDFETLRELKKFLRASEQAPIHLAATPDEEEPEEEVEEVKKEEVVEEPVATPVGRAGTKLKKCDFCGDYYGVKKVQPALRNCCGKLVCKRSYAEFKRNYTG